MESNKFFPDVLGETKLGTYYVSPFFSLKTDDEFRTIWLNLETKKGYFLKKPVSAFSLPVIRKSLGKNSDFVLYFNKIFLPLFEIFKNHSIPIPQMIQIILNPQTLGQEQQELINYIQNETKSFTINEKKELIRFINFVQGLQKEPLPKLIDESKYTLVFGFLDSRYEIENNVATKTTIQLKKQNITVDDVKNSFGGIVLSEKNFNSVFIALGLPNILSDPPKFPEVGGAIFIDQGGTGKSLMKSSLKKFWKKLGGICIEKNGIAEFSGDVNYARLIFSWYFGNSNPQEQGYDKQGLFNAAIDKKVPSLLIIDEADRFVKSSDEEHRDIGAEMIINEFKRYLTERSEGGVLGYVLTVFIANVDEKDLNPQLKMGGERLIPVYFGPPTQEKDWLELIEIYFKKSKLQFQDRNKSKDIVLAKLILKHNDLMPHEKFMIPPRKFGSEFCGNYLQKYFIEEENDARGEDRFSRLHSMLHSSSKKKEVLVHYDHFLKHIIEDLLLKEVRLAGLDIDLFRADYFRSINLNSGDEQEESSETTKLRLENDEFKAFMKIYRDNDVQRIIRAKNGFEVLGLSGRETNDEKQDKFRRMIKKNKFNSRSAAFFNDEKYKIDICVDFIEQLNKSISNYNPRNNNLEKDHDTYVFTKFNNYAHGIK